MEAQVNAEKKDNNKMFSSYLYLVVDVIFSWFSKNL